jgi:N-acetylmuramoyl-L-alanine amidase
VKRSGLRDRGVSSAGFLVLHKTVMPSILVELGFISNRKEESVLASKNGQKNLAKGIFEGFKEYYRLYGTTTAKEKSSKKKSKAATAAVKPATEPVAATTKKEAAQKGQPVFKVQILASSTKLTAKDSRLKGVKADYYKEGGMYKYTCGNSTDYNEIAALRKKLATTFKEAFVIAFIDGKKADTKKAIEIYKKQAK